MDIRIDDNGSIQMVIPMTDAGQEWVDENLQAESWQKYGPAIAVDIRYIDAIREGAIADGLEVEYAT